MNALEARTKDWLEGLGFAPKDENLWLKALTHGSHESEENYERLEFLGDRVLGLAVADWLIERQVGPEGKLSQRLNALVSRKTCAAIGVDIGVSPHIRLGKQAREDGGANSTNILGDVVEALLGACFIEHGYKYSRKIIQQMWENHFEGDLGRSKHPKSALQEWAAGNRRKAPEYELIGRSGPDHAAEFTVRVSVNNVGEAEATASSKSEAERRAAKAFMEKFA